ncbi:hypothetical protein [Holospora undulata]|uniref:hypothetical protein n=1 Tax=Holospora undulata TaxID=1169117 RepID=UPI0012690FC7|nr:hypothetical protein [Holospora undulata]
MLTPSRVLLYITTADLDMQNLSAIFSNDNPCFVFNTFFENLEPVFMNKKVWYKRPGGVEEELSKRYKKERVGSNKASF